MSCVIQVLLVDYMPVVTVDTVGKPSYLLTRLAWHSEAALEIQENAVELLIERSSTHNVRDQYSIR